MLRPCLGQLVGGDLARRFGSDRLCARRRFHDGLRRGRHRCGRRRRNRIGRRRFVDGLLRAHVEWLIDGLIDGLIGCGGIICLRVRFVVAVVIGCRLFVIEPHPVVDALVFQRCRIRKRIVGTVDETADRVGELRTQTGEPAGGAGQSATQLTEWRH